MKTHSVYLKPVALLMAGILFLGINLFAGDPPQKKVIEVVITKSMTHAEINAVKEELKSHGITLHIDFLWYGNGEISHIKGRVKVNHFTSGSFCAHNDFDRIELRFAPGYCFGRNLEICIKKDKARN